MNAKEQGERQPIAQSRNAKELPVLGLLTEILRSAPAWIIRTL